MLKRKIRGGRTRLIFRNPTSGKLLICISLYIINQLIYGIHIDTDGTVVVRMLLLLPVCFVRRHSSWHYTVSR
jgi:hypothetical protein